MERTFFASFCRTTNLLVALRDPSFPHFLRPLVPLIDPQLACDSESHQLKARHSVDTLEAFTADSPLPQHVYDALLQRLLEEPRLSDYTYYRSIHSPANPSIPVLNPDAHGLPSITHMGRKFCSANRSIGDSNIMFRVSRTGDMSRGAFGQIQSIFKHKRSVRGGEFRHEVFLDIKVYQPLSQIDGHLDPYDALDGLGTRLVRAEFGSEPVVIPLTDVVCHVVMCPFRNPASVPQPAYPCSVVVALDEVGL